MPIRGKGVQIDEGDLQDHLPVRNKDESLFLQKFIFYNENEDDNENKDDNENEDDNENKILNIKDETDKTS